MWLHLERIAGSSGTFPSSVRAIRRNPLHQQQEPTSTTYFFEAVPGWQLAAGLFHGSFPKPRSSRALRDHCTVLVRMAKRRFQREDLASATNSEAGHFRPSVARRWLFSRKLSFGRRRCRGFASVQPSSVGCLQDVAYHLLSGQLGHIMRGVQRNRLERLSIRTMREHTTLGHGLR